MRWWLALGILVAGVIPTPATAQALVLDEEFNQYAQSLAAPLRAKLVPGRAVNYVLVNDPSINAFVTAEDLIFVHSGLIKQAKTAAELQGVLAHELGHLQAGHLQQRQQQGKRALLPVLAGAVLGAGAAIAGAPQAAVALALGGQAAGIQTILGYTRVQEQEADQYALQALQNAGFSASGMVGLFTTLRTQGQLSYDSPPPWLVSHPLPVERLARLTMALEAEQGRKNNTNNALSPAAWARMQAKVAALTDTPASVLRRYGGNTAPEQYARSLALLRQGKVAESAALLAPLLKAAAGDAYYQELQGQQALAKSDIYAAINAFKSALRLTPQGLLLRYQLAEALRASNQDAEAAGHYQAITRAWPVWPEPWEGLGRTLGRGGQLAASHLAFTEAALAAGDIIAAKQSLNIAQNYLKKPPTPTTTKTGTSTGTSTDSTAWAAQLAERLKEK